MNNDQHSRAKSMAEEGAVACVRALMGTYLHMQLWETEFYEKIEPEIDRNEFASMVSDGDLVDTVVCLIKSCLFAKIPLVDIQIRECVFAAIAIASGRMLSEAERTNLSIGWQELFAKLIRYEVATDQVQSNAEFDNLSHQAPTEEIHREVRAAMAIASLARNPDATIAEIAAEVGMKRSSVYSLPGFKDALAKLKGPKRDRTGRHGFRMTDGIECVD